VILLHEGSSIKQKLRGCRLQNLFANKPRLFPSFLTMDSKIARATFEFSNNIVTIDPTQDQIYRYNNDEQVQINQEKPWTKE